jgi:hypothetical protein
MARKPSGLPTPPPLPRPNSHEIPRQQAGWLSGTPAAVSNPAGTAYFPFGPGTKTWAKTGGPALTTGAQKKRK